MLYIPKLNVISLVRRSDRRTALKPKLDSLALPQSFEWFDAIEPKNTKGTELNTGQLGCFRSHQTVIRQAKENNEPYCFIAEDDIDFPFYQNWSAQFQYYLRLLPDVWDFMYLSGNHQSGINMFKQDLYRNIAIGTCARIYSTAHYMVHSRVYDEILAMKPYKNPIDVDYVKIHQRGYTFTAIPSLSYQTDSYSDVEQSFVTNRKKDTSIGL